MIFATSELRGFVNQVAADMDLKDDGDGKDFLGAKSLGWRLKRLRIRRPDARFATAKTWVITMPELQRLERANGILSPDASDDDTPSVTTA